ncbi:unnamed protein product [Soboliphyme baturini]|uniref:WAPL domain-containing protein n=1 Tax=Soboliphyme baturini TaxID=241478 RepID=A0A183IS99_9BILA|nr:unnamed protein product [Soboliphyme baturini]
MCVYIFFSEAILSLTRDADVATLIQVLRVLSTAVESNRWNEFWDEAFFGRDCFADVVFMVLNSTNADLILSAAQFIDMLMDHSMRLKIALAERRLPLDPLFDAVRTTADDGNTLTCTVLIRAVYSLTTFEEGVQTLLQAADNVISALDHALSTIYKADCRVDAETLKVFLLILRIVKILACNASTLNTGGEICRKISEHISRSKETKNHELFHRIHAELNELMELVT